MFNFTTNTYEMKREILNFTKKISINLSQSILFSNIARKLSEDTKLKRTIERLCLNCNNFNENNLNILENNYFNEKQPVSLYSKIYSTVSEDFISCNNETMKAKDVVLCRLRNNNAKKIFIKDRGYDTFELFQQILIK